MSDVQAVICSDIHLSHSPPAYRSQEPSWYEAMARTMDEVVGICNEKNAPLFIAGDVFDRWNSPAELIYFAIAKFGQVQRGVYSIPGQHDLPQHRYDEQHRSAYGVLEAAGVLIDLEPGMAKLLPNMPFSITVFPWNHEIAPPSKQAQEGNCIALIHEYVWADNYGYPGADKEQNVKVLKDKVKGFDVSFFEDNHKPFHDERAGVYNCGGLFIRKSDDNHKPGVALLHEDMTVETHYMDVSKDKYLTQFPILETDDADAQAYLESMKEFETDSIDFREVVLRSSIDLPGDVREMVLKDLLNDND